MICFMCFKKPDEIEEYIDQAKESDLSPDEYVRQEEGTYNSKTDHFCCTDCYIKIGMPSDPRGWIAP